MILDSAVDDARGQTVHGFQRRFKNPAGMLFHRMHLTAAGCSLRATSVYFYLSNTSGTFSDVHGTDDLWTEHIELFMKNQGKKDI